MLEKTIIEFAVGVVQNGYSHNSSYEEVSDGLDKFKEYLRDQGRLTMQIEALIDLIKENAKVIETPGVIVNFDVDYYVSLLHDEKLAQENSTYQKILAGLSNDTKSSLESSSSSTPVVNEGYYESRRETELACGSTPRRTTDHCGVPVSSHNSCGVTIDHCGVPVEDYSYSSCGSSSRGSSRC